MKIEDFAEIPAGQILRVVDDGGFMAGHGAMFKRLTVHGMAEVKIKGAIFWISLERLKK